MPQNIFGAYTKVIYFPMNMFECHMNFLDGHVLEVKEAVYVVKRTHFNIGDASLYHIDVLGGQNGALICLNNLFVWHKNMFA